MDRHAALTVQALYDQATAEMDAGKYASACGKLEEVTRLAPDGLGAKLTLGQCYEAWGKLASAWAQYTLVEAMAAKAGQAERSTRAGEKAAALKPRLATLTIDVSAAVRAYPGLAITRDGVPLGQAQLGASLPVDAGEHEVVATAPGHKPWRRSAAVGADGDAVSVAIPALESERPASAPAQRGARDVTPAPGSGQRVAGLVIGGAGLLGVGVGAFFGVSAKIKRDESNEDGHCLGTVCDDVGAERRNQAWSAGNVSTVLFLAGGAALAGGVTLFLTAPAPERPSARVALGPHGITVQGGF
ncbi:tetratricopeptide repeat protein [Sorangium sp. So ce1182]|uniref:tetratricopeptide repeat protein n=1 Tax=Sorangium sp. So ce1182 TaxID=3133334 RepID=UPI003F6013B5